MRDYEEKSYYEIQLDNKQLILVFLAGMTVCVLIFVLGVMVGKGKKEAEMAAMKNEVTTTTAAPSPDVTSPQEIRPAVDADDRRKERKNRKGEKEEGDAKSSDEYAFYDLDKSEAQQPLTKEPVPDTTQKKTSTKEADKTEQDSKTKSETIAKKESEAKKAEETTKVEKESTKQEPVVEAVRTSLPDTTEDEKEEVKTEATDEGGRFTVQVMATASKTKADEQLQFLKAKGYTAFMNTDQIQGGSVYKIRVGKFSDPSIAKKTATRIKQDLKLDTWVAVLD